MPWVETTEGVHVKGKEVTVTVHDAVEQTR